MTPFLRRRHASPLHAYFAIGRHHFFAFRAYAMPSFRYFRRAVMPPLSISSRFSPLSSVVVIRFFCCRLRRLHFAFSVISISFFTLLRRRRCRLLPPFSAHVRLRLFRRRRQRFRRVRRLLTPTRRRFSSPIFRYAAAVADDAFSRLTPRFSSFCHMLIRFHYFLSLPHILPYRQRADRFSLMRADGFSLH